MEYVDGLSLYAAYFALAHSDPYGTVTAAIGAGYGCGVGVAFSLFQSWIDGDGPCKCGCKAFVSCFFGGIGGGFISGFPGPVGKCMLSAANSLAGTFGKHGCSALCGEPAPKNFGCSLASALINSIAGCVLGHVAGAKQKEVIDRLAVTVWTFASRATGLAINRVCQVGFDDHALLGCQTRCGNIFHWLWDRPQYLGCGERCNRRCALGTCT